MKDDKKLFLSYTKDSDDVRLEYEEGGKIRYFRIYIVANGAFLIRTADEGRCLGLKDGFLSLYAEDATSIKDLTWWIEINQQRLTQFKAEIKNPVNNDTWICQMPLLYNPVPVHFSSEDQYWMITKHGSGKDYESYFEIVAVYTEGGNKKSLYAAYDAHAPNHVTFLDDSTAGDRQFVLKDTGKGRFNILLRDRQLYTTVDKPGSDPSKGVLCFADSVRDAVQWESPMVGIYVNGRHLSGAEIQQI